MRSGREDAACWLKELLLEGHAGVPACRPRLEKCRVRSGADPGYKEWFFMWCNEQKAQWGPKLSKFVTGLRGRGACPHHALQATSSLWAAGLHTPVPRDS